MEVVKADSVIEVKEPSPEKIQKKEDRPRSREREKDSRKERPHHRSRSHSRTRRRRSRSRWFMTFIINSYYVFWFFMANDLEFLSIRKSLKLSKPHFRSYSPRRRQSPRRRMSPRRRSPPRRGPTGSRHRHRRSPVRRSVSPAYWLKEQLLSLTGLVPF